MKLEQYHYLREMELEAALFESKQDLSEGRFSKEKVDDHIADVFGA